MQFSIKQFLLPSLLLKLIEIYMFLVLLISLFLEFNFCVPVCMWEFFITVNKSK
jgi:hypothetical protein